MSDIKPTQIQFGTQEAQHQSGPLSQELAENLYLEMAPKGAKSKYILIGTPGLKAFTRPASGAVRGVIGLNNYIFAVIGQELYRVSSAGASTLVGTVLGSGNVRMAQNGFHVWIATNDKLYAADATSIIELPESNMVGVGARDGYMLGLQGGNQRFFISGQGATGALTINPLDFTTVDAYPGLSVGMVEDSGDVFCMMDGFIQAHRNTGNALFPFPRAQVITKGCGAGNSIVQYDNVVYWLGDDLQVYAMSGYQPVPISTAVVAELIRKETSPQTTNGFIYQQDGHTFYVMLFSGMTLAYDLKTRRWARRRSDGLDRWRVNCHVWMKNWRKHIVGDYTTGDLYELDPATCDENGSVLRRRAIGAPVFNTGDRTRINEFFLDIEAGVGLATGQGSDPEAMLDWTVDGGKTWSNELWRTFGKIGKRGWQARWTSLGSHDNWTPRITISDPVPVRISGAYVRAEQLAA